MIDKLRVQIAPTAQGVGHYLQILSGDTLSVNIALVAGEIIVDDQRNAPNVRSAARRPRRRGSPLG